MIVAEATPLEMAWTTVAAIGTLTTFALLYMAITDYRLLVTRGLNSWRKQVAGTSIWIFAGGTLTQTIYLVTGIIALQKPNSHVTEIGSIYISQALFLFGAFTSTIAAIIIFYRRLHILDVIENSLKEEIQNDIEGHRKAGVNV